MASKVREIIMLEQEKHYLDEICPCGAYYDEKTTLTFHFLIYEEFINAHTSYMVN